MTLQEAFNKALFGVLAQGGRSVDEDGRCQHRGLNGRKCSVGHLIDGRTAAGLEGAAIGNHPDVAAALGLPLTFLHHLQLAHDDCFDPKTFAEDFKAGMRDLAYYWDLTMPETEEVK